MKPEYARNLMRMQFFKYAYYYNMSKIYEDLYLKSSKNINVKNLMPIIKNKRNMLIAIKGIRNVVHMLEMIWSSIGIKLENGIIQKENNS